MRALLLFLCLAAMPGMATAQLSRGATCVQDQLRSAGFDPGPSDGQVGPATRRALSDFEQQVGTVSNRELDAVLGNSFCRNIGLLRPELQQFWPSRDDGAYELIVGSGITEDVERTIRASIELAFDMAHDFYRVDVAGRDIIVVSDDPNELFSLATENLDIPIVNLRASVSDACASRRWVFGTVYPGLLLICVSEQNAERDQVWMDFFVGHEVTHLLQFQLSGAVRTELGDDMSLRFEGPVWLYEGIAQAFGNRVAVQRPDWDFRLVNYRRLEEQFPDLSELELNSASDRRQPEVHRAGSVGAIDLIDLFGYPAIAAFYENLGAGLFWEDAFLEAFGISVEAFYFHYQNVDRFDDAGNPITGPLSVLAE